MDDIQVRADVFEKHSLWMGEATEAPVPRRIPDKSYMISYRWFGKQAVEGQECWKVAARCTDWWSPEDQGMWPKGGVKWCVPTWIMFFRADDITLWFVGEIWVDRDAAYASCTPALTERGPWYFPEFERFVPLFDFPVIPRSVANTEEWFPDDQGCWIYEQDEWYDPERFVRQSARFKSIRGTLIMETTLRPPEGCLGKVVVHVWQPRIPALDWWTSAVAYYPTDCVARFTEVKTKRGGAWPQELREPLEKEIRFLGVPWLLQ